MKKFDYSVVFVPALLDAETLSIWGEDGWELCAVIPLKGDYQYVFKHQIIT